MFLVSSTFLTSNYIGLFLSLGVRHKCVKENYTPQRENVTSRPNLGNDKIGCKLVLIINRKSRTCFGLAPNW